MIQDFLMGQTLMIHVVNTAMKIMSARYPRGDGRHPVAGRRPAPPYLW
jgi:hypothetical protein